jgi:hypothetical protein
MTGAEPTTSYTSGTVLTCSHDGCGCRVRIEAECHCPDSGAPYQCSCGAPMVPAAAPDNAP